MLNHLVSLAADHPVLSGLAVPIALGILAGVWRSLANPGLPNALIYIANRSDLKLSEKQYGMDLMLGALASQVTSVVAHYRSQHLLRVSALLLLGCVLAGSLFLAIGIRTRAYRTAQPGIVPRRKRDGDLLILSGHVVEVKRTSRYTWILRNPWASDIPNIVGVVTFLLVYVSSVK